jgi:putative CocE/NonD family hydrolase
MDRVGFSGFALACALVGSATSAQDIPLARPLTGEAATLAADMSEIAIQAIADYRESDRDRYLDNVFRLQLVAGRYRQALETLRALRDLRARSKPIKSNIENIRWEIYARARRMQATQGTALSDALQQFASTALRRLDDKTAYAVLYSLATPLEYLKRTFDQALEAQAGKSQIRDEDAIDLVRKYLAVAAYQQIQPEYASISDRDDAQRYVVEKNASVHTLDGATVCVWLVRPRRVARLPALLNFTIYFDPVVKLDDARRTAANGYVGVEAFTRGKACSPDSVVPIEHDGADAAAVIDWISGQPWSDARVGMYGGSYEGFTQWAAAKHLPPALKAIMPSVTFAPGVDFPMEGNISLSQAFSWPRYTTDNKGLDNDTYYDQPHWDRLHREWYVTGRAYRDLDKIDGTPNPFFDRWLEHPSYDSYWQALIPYHEDFARINIPVLTTTGYYDSGQIGALYYFIQHYQYNPQAQHYLVIGPYDHHSAQLGTISPTGTIMSKSLRGYPLDPVAQLDIGSLRYQWFDYIFKGGRKPPLLQDRVNYEVMGANTWKHAPSIAAMADQRTRYYLSALRGSTGWRLRTQPDSGDAFVTQEVSLTDRSDVDRMLSGGPIIDQTDDTWNIIDRSTNLANGITFVSDPFASSTEISGLFTGKLDFVANKRDLDFGVTLFELTEKGEYLQLSYCWHRASYTADRSHRELLTPGKRTQLSFEAGRLTSRQLQAGSRLVVVLAIIKQPGEQINYGTGESVSDETIADGKIPLRLDWYDDSYVEVPTLH